MTAFFWATGTVCLATTAQAQTSCLTVERLRVTERNGDVCRFAGAVLNRCAHEVRYAVVRAVSHPERGPLPTTTGSVERYRLALLNFDREICLQGHHILEVAGDGALRDVTSEPITPAIAPNQLMETAERLNVCVKGCAPPDLDRTAILASLRQHYGTALDHHEATPAIDDIVNATIIERQGKDRLCAAVCHGTVRPGDVIPATVKLEEESRAGILAAATLLATLAARPAPIETAQANILPDRDEGASPPRRTRKGKVKRQAFANSNRCHATGRSGRCRFVLDVEPRGRGGKASSKRP